MGNPVDEDVTIVNSFSTVNIIYLACRSYGMSSPAGAVVIAGENEERFR
jgi:hypothetical protein